MDQELKQYLDNKFSLLDARFANIDARFANIDARFADIETRFATKEDLERVETALLTAFHQWASPSEARARSHTANLQALDLEMEVLKDRVQKLENRQ